MTLSKPMDSFCKKSTYIAVNIKNDLDIVPLFRDGKDPSKALEDKRFLVLKMLDPINSTASTKERI